MSETDDVLIVIIPTVMSVYGVWSLRRDWRRGRASARGFSFGRDAQPKRYNALMAFNGVVVTLLVIGALIGAVGLSNDLWGK